MHVGVVGPCSSGLLADLLPDSGGVDIGCGGYLIATLVRALVDRGHRVSVITLSPQLKEPIVFSGARLTYYACPTRLRRRMRDLFGLERRGLRAGIRLTRPDILHAHWTYEFAWASLETGLPTVVTTHDNGFQQLRFFRDPYRLGRLCMQLRVIRTAQHLTAVSPYLARSLQWWANAEIRIIPNPITLPKDQTAGGDSLKAPLEIATVLNGWGKRKNPKPAIRAFNLLRVDVPEAKLFMFGDGFEEHGPAHQWAAAKKLDEHIFFCGLLPYQELQKRLQNMSLLLHPALEEACPMALLEAMALGLPVVGGQESGGVPWVLDHGRAGYLADVRSPWKIKQALMDCIVDDAGREERRQAARARTMELFSPDVVAAQYEGTYREVLSRRVH